MEQTAKNKEHLQEHFLLTETKREHSAKLCISLVTNKERECKYIKTGANSKFSFLPRKIHLKNDK